MYRPSIWDCGHWGLLVVILVIGSELPAEFIPRHFEARRARTAPVIDGHLTDAAWSQAVVIDEFFAYQSGGAPAAAQTSARLMWDDLYLYVGFEMEDSDIRSSCGLTGQCGHDSSLFQGDVIELFLKQDRGATPYYEFEWSPRGEDFDARFDVRFGSPGTAFESGLTSAAHPTGTVDNGADTDILWTAEAAIPLGSLAAFDPVSPGTEWYFTVARYDYFNHPPDPQPQLMMSTPGDPTAPNGGVTHGFHTYEIYDILDFVTVPEPPAVTPWSVLWLCWTFRRRCDPTR